MLRDINFSTFVTFETITRYIHLMGFETPITSAPWTYMGHPTHTPAGDSSLESQRLARAEIKVVITLIICPEAHPK
jgi:hypothetical protein